MIRVLIVERTALMCNLTRAAIEPESDIVIIGATTSKQEAINALGKCDVMVVRHEFAQSLALQMVEHVARHHPGVKPVVLDVPRSHLLILPYIEAGAAGYVLDNDSLHRMAYRIRGVYKGEPIVDPDVVGSIIERLVELTRTWQAKSSGLQQASALTKREQEVLGFIAQGATNRQIAEKLNIEIGTVKNHVHHILKKLDVSSRNEASSYFASLKPTLKEAEADAVQAESIGISPEESAVISFRKPSLLQ